MLKVFGKTDQNFSSNGDVVLRPLKAKIRKEDNGDYYLDLETSLEYIDYLVEGNLIIANTPQGDQGFRITNPKKTRNKITLRAWHLFYDLEDHLIADSYVENKTCQDALNWLNNAAEPSTAFTFVSNLDSSIINSYRCVRTSLCEAVDTVLERWGGHLVRNNFLVGIFDDIGQDNGITVRYKKNLKEITCEESWDSVVTKLLPVGKNGILLNEVDSSASIYLESGTQYELPYCKTVSFSQDVSEDDYKGSDNKLNEDAYKRALVEDLRAQALRYLSEHCVPEISYTIQANIEKLTDIGDVVDVIDERLGVDIRTRVIAFEYDCILGKYTKVEFGNFQRRLNSLISNIQTSVGKTTDKKIEDAQIVLNNEISQKVDKVSGMGLSSNDFTDALKAKLEAIDDDIIALTVDSELSDESENPVQNKVLKAALDDKVNVPDFLTNREIEQLLTNAG